MQTKKKDHIPYFVNISKISSKKKEYIKKRKKKYV